MARGIETVVETYEASDDSPNTVKPWGKLLLWPLAFELILILLLTIYLAVSGVDYNNYNFDYDYKEYYYKPDYYDNGRDQTAYRCAYWIAPSVSISLAVFDLVLYKCKILHPSYTVTIAVIGLLGWINQTYIVYYLVFYSGGIPPPTNRASHITILVFGVIICCTYFLYMYASACAVRPWRRAKFQAEASRIQSAHLSPSAMRLAKIGLYRYTIPANDLLILLLIVPEVIVSVLVKNSIHEDIFHGSNDTPKDPNVAASEASWYTYIIVLPAISAIAAMVNSILWFSNKMSLEYTVSLATVFFIGWVIFSGIITNNELWYDSSKAHAHVGLAWSVAVAYFVELVIAAAGMDRVSTLDNLTGVQNADHGRSSVVSPQ